MPDAFKCTLSERSCTRTLSLDTMAHPKERARSRRRPLAKQTRLLMESTLETQAVERRKGHPWKRPARRPKASQEADNFPSNSGPSFDASLTAACRRMAS